MSHYASPLQDSIAKLSNRIFALNLWIQELKSEQTERAENGIGPDLQTEADIEASEANLRRLQKALLTLHSLGFGPPGG